MNSLLSILYRGAFIESWDDMGEYTFLIFCGWGWEFSDLLSLMSLGIFS